MKQYSKAIVAVLGCLVSVFGWNIDSSLIGSAASIISALLVYMIPNAVKDRG